MGNLNKNDEAVKQEDNMLITDPSGKDYKTGDGTSKRILERWRNGVIICLWPKLFWNDDDIEMK